MPLNNEVTAGVKTIVENFVSNFLAGNTLPLWTRAAIIFLTIFIFLILIKIFFSKIYQSHLKTHHDDYSFRTFLFSNLGITNVFVIFFVAIYPAIISLKMPPRIDELTRYIFIVAVFAQIIIWANNSLNIYGQKYLQKNPNAVTAMNVFSLMWKVAAFTVIIVIMLDQLGFNITALIAGLGVGGIAIAFALQSILSDVFASLAIILDKPFKVGDTIQINTFVGRIEKVGLKTTRIRSIVGEQLVFSNSELLKSTIQNYGNMQERRVEFMLGVLYETPFDQLKKIPDLLREAVFSESGTSIDHITLRQLADSSLKFEVVYFIQNVDQINWLEVENNINLEIVRLFEKEGISFAYPTRTVYTKNL